MVSGPAGGQVCSSQLRGPVQARKGADLPRITVACRLAGRRRFLGHLACGIAGYRQRARIKKSIYSILISLPFSAFTFFSSSTERTPFL